MTPNEIQIIELAKKKGNDADLLLLDKIQKLEFKIDFLEKKLDNELVKESPVIQLREVQKIAIEGVELIKGDKGDDYILTSNDKKEIAKMINVPIVEKIIEKKEIIKEQPIITEITKITNEIKEIAITESAEQIRDKLELLKNDERIDKSSIKGLEEEINQLKEWITSQKVGLIGARQLRGSRFSFTGNGSTTVFTLPHEPAMKGLAIWAYYNGQWLQPTVHFTIARKTFTTTFTASVGTTIEGFLIML